MCCALPAERCCMSAEVLFLCTEQNWGFRMGMVVGRCLGVCHVTRQIQVKHKKYDLSVAWSGFWLLLFCIDGVGMALACFFWTKMPLIGMLKNGCQWRGDRVANSSMRICAPAECAPSLTGCLSLLVLMSSLRPVVAGDVKLLGDFLGWYCPPPQSCTQMNLFWLV